LSSSPFESASAYLILLQELPSSELSMPIADGNDVCPETKASLFSVLSFGWLTPLMKKGYSQPLDFRDIWQIPPHDSVKVVSAKFERHWHKQNHSGVPPVLCFYNYPHCSDTWPVSICEASSQKAL
jgi:hypothetical protein